MPRRQLVLSFIFLTAVIDSIGFGILMPVLPSLYMKITGEGQITRTRNLIYLL